MNTNRVYFVMGVSGSGKTTIGQMLASKLAMPFFDGDDFHPQSNIDKMKKRQPLTDEDRKEWLDSLHELAKDQIHKNGCVIACSALKNKYRSRLHDEIRLYVKWIYLHGSFEQILERLQMRQDHFMPTDLLKSQFSTLEEPENSIRVPINLAPEAMVAYILNEVKTKSEFGLYGLGVMGKSLSRNFADKGVRLSLFNRHVAGIEENIAINFRNEHSELANSLAFDDSKSFIDSLELPRKIFLMVKAGPLMDTIIDELLPFLSPGDILIDGGNSNYKDTERRNSILKKVNIHFVGTGVSGGEEGALNGPSIMPGCDAEIYPEVQPYFNAIAAKDSQDKPCCSYIGKGGSGHFVKMVHNGIEYAEMQLLAEVYDLLTYQKKNPDEIADVLSEWNKESYSYLLDITIHILRKRENDDWLIHKILDKAGNKGTGSWATEEAASIGYPATMIASALFARFTSSFKEERVSLENHYPKRIEKSHLLNIDKLKSAYNFARMINHHQGFQLIEQASKEHNWKLNLSEIARIWTGGCIIKSDLMADLSLFYQKEKHLLINDDYMNLISEDFPALKEILIGAIHNDISVPCFQSAMNYFLAMKTAQSPANLIQAQRDFFGAHTYQRIDDANGNSHHTKWN